MGKCQRLTKSGLVTAAGHRNHATHRLTQRTVKFIRRLKNHLDLERNRDAAMARLAFIYRHS